MKFNLSKYRELLIKTESSTKQGKEYFQDPDVLELLALESSLETQILYDQKIEILNLIQNYLDEKLLPGEFRNQYLNISTQSMKKVSKSLQNEEELSNFFIESRLKNFSLLFSEITEACQCIVEFGTGNEGISEEKFRDLVEKVMIEMKFYYSTSE